MTKTINTAYSPKTFAAIKFMEPEKYFLLTDYFYSIPYNTSVPTVNLTLGIISSTMSHYARTVGEYLAVRKSCETGLPVKTNKGSLHEALNGCIFAYAADLPMAVLRDIIKKHPDSCMWPEFRTEKALKEREEAEKIRKNNEKLKKILDILEEK